MITREVHSPGVLARDFLLFCVKLVIDALKDVALIQIGVLAFCVDVILMLLTGTRRSLFYTVLEFGEKFDLWLNLYRPASRAAANRDGLFGESRAGDNSFLGGMEEMVRGRTEPVRTPPSASAPLRGRGREL
ncbi:MAG TPA: hypothetical protein VEX86_27445 [Longimicrobium sp.]|nr:hypothetical protein [Longimicrobium sp.]